MVNHVGLRVFLSCCATFFVLEISLAKETESVVKKEKVVATLTEKQVAEFSDLVQAKNMRREEWIITGRLFLEKKGELKKFMDEMSKEFSMASDKSYTFETESRSLYLLSTNKMDKAGNPERSLVRQLKSDSEVKYITRLMVARRLTEQQISVLAQIREEKSKEFALIDAKLRQTFKLDPKASYRLDNQSAQILCVSEEPVKDAQAKDNSAVGKSKGSSKRK